MARTKEFDTDDVVLKAIEVFWSKGFEATSISDLVEAMGINRGSIYDTFGDKAGLFELAIQRYQIDAPSQRLLDNAETGDIAPWREARSLARSLLASAQGLIVVSKVEPGRETLADIAETALSLLD